MPQCWSINDAKLQKAGILSCDKPVVLESEIDDKKEVAKVDNLLETSNEKLKQSTANAAKLVNVISMLRGV